MSFSTPTDSSPTWPIDDSHEKTSGVSRCPAVASVAASKACAHQRTAIWFWIAMVVLVIAWTTASRVWGQGVAFEAFPLAERMTTPAIEKQVESLAKQLITSRDVSSMTDRDRAMARFYLTQFIVWKLTQTSNLPIVATTINDVVDNISRGQRSGAPGTMEYMRYAFEGLKVMAEGNYMPATRINATLALSRIELRPFDPQTNKPPVPLPNSFAVLVGLYENEKNPDGVRAAALQGLNFYASVGFATMPADQRQKLTKIMTSLLESPAPEGRSVKAHAYLQRFAVDSLNAMTPGENKELGTQLVGISSGKDSPDLIALYSASKLGNYRQSLKGTIADPTPMLNNWSSRAFFAVEAELARLKALKRPLAAMPQPPTPDSFLTEKKTKKADAPATRGGMNQGMMGMDPSMMGGPGMGGRGMDDQAAYEMMGMDPGMMGAEFSGMEMGMGMGMGMVPANKPQPPEVSISRRQLTHVLQQILRGATGSSKGEISNTPGGLLAAVPADKSKSVTEWVAGLKPVATALNDPTLDDQFKWVAALEKERLVLAKLAGIEIVEDVQIDADEPNGWNGIPGMFAEPPAAGQPDQAIKEPVGGLPGVGP